MTNRKLRRSSGTETSQVWMFLETTLTGLIGGLLFCAVFFAVFAAAGPDAFAQHFHGLSVQTVMLLLIGAGLAGGVIAAIAGPWVTSRGRAMLVAIPVVMPTAAVFQRMASGPLILQNAGTWLLLLLSSVMFGIMGGNIHWTDRKRRSAQRHASR